MKKNHRCQKESSIFPIGSISEITIWFTRSVSSKTGKRPFIFISLIQLSVILIRWYVAYIYIYCFKNCLYLWKDCCRPQGAFYKIYSANLILWWLTNWETKVCLNLLSFATTFVSSLREFDVKNYRRSSVQCEMRPWRNKQAWEEHQSRFTPPRVVLCFDVNCWSRVQMRR